MVKTARNCSTIPRIAPCASRSPNGPPGCNVHPSIAPVLVRAGGGTNLSCVEGVPREVISPSHHQRKELSPQTQVASKGWMRAWSHLRGGALGGVDAEERSLGCWG